jgi:hypothetical protein
VEGIPNTPHELVFGVKPDLQVLFHLFSTGFFQKLHDGNHHQSDISESRSIHNKQLYTSSDYKLDKGRSTPNTFNLL